jgi:hypothetical protein
MSIYQMRSIAKRLRIDVALGYTPTLRQIPREIMSE